MGTERSRFVELLLKEETESVAMGIEQGLFCWEEMDLPHDSNGCTPLISACRMGLTTVMHFLLERGADATLCNHSNQTALHVSQPALQGEHLLALIRDLPHQMQLSDAAWRGDLCSIQDLMAQTELLDVNKQNSDGLTPLMLAVRDVDLFEGLQLPWKYQPVEVVKELMTLLVETKIQDQRGHTALWYVSQVKSAKREELLRIIDSVTQAETMFTCLECYWPGGSAVSPSCSPTRDCCTPEMENQQGSPLPKITLQTSSKITECPEEHLHLHSSSLCPLGFQKTLLVAAFTILQPHTLSPSLKRSSTMRGACLTRLFGLLCPKRFSQTTQLSTQNLLLQTLANKDYLKNQRNTLKHLVLVRLELFQRTTFEKDNRICTGGSMEPKINIRKSSDERKQSSRTSSLPSLWDSRKRWDKTRPSHPLLKTSSQVPVFPAPHFTQLSKSTPTLMDPLLDASMLLQARANIHNRLIGGDTEDDVIIQKMSLPNPLRTLKHLAPLDSGCRDVCALSSLEHPQPVKPPSTFPFSTESRLKVERISRQSFRRSRSTRVGSEESNSSTSSSQESQEEEETVPAYSKETFTIFGILEKSVDLELESHLDFQDLHSAEMNNSTKNTDIIISDNMKDNAVIGSSVVREVNAKMRNDSKMSTNLDNIQIKSQNIDLIDSYCNEPTEIPPSVKDNRSCFIASKKDLATVNITVVEQIVHEKSKAMKMIKRNDRKCKTSLTTNQSFNILAHKNQSTAKTTRNVINSPIHLKVKIRESKPTCQAAETPNKKTTDELPTTKKVSEMCQHMRLGSDDKKMSNNNQNQLHRDLKSAGPSKKPVLGATLRARSAVDHVTYNDMFLKISQGDEGPAIYEMFATPVYENLRVDISAERNKQGHTALQVKRQINGKQKGQKTVEVNRRNQSQSQRCSRARGRQHKRRDHIPKRIKKHPPPSENICHKVTSDCEAEEEQRNYKIYHIEDDRKEMSIKRQNSPTLSVIEEVLSNTASKPNTPQLNKSATRFETHLIKHTMHQNPQTPTDSGAKAQLETSSIPAQPLINTWTSDRTVSPVHQRFLEEVGDGPLTDDLLRSLAEGLISLEKRDDETFETEEDDGKQFSNNLPSKFKKLLNEDVSAGELQYANRSCSDDAGITWTKGEVLGKGAYGTVYCGLTNQGQLIAVKQVLLDASTSEIAENEYERLEREVDLLKNLQHSNIIGFLGTALYENVVSIFMEYVPGGSIASILSRFGPLPEKVFALYTQQILEGVAYLHANKVIHRDLKGNNIMLMPTGVVKLIDFGCSRRLNCLTLSGSKCDLVKSVHGTPYWMAPEVINETGHGRKSDIWSIGCTVFEMATGKPPLAHMAKMAALFYIGAHKGLMPSLPDAFSTHAKGFVQACLTRDPRQRPSAVELLRHPIISHHSTVCKRPFN